MGSPEFGVLLRRYRLAVGLSQEALAERARMSINGISALERGYRQTPQRETLALLAGALALSGTQRQAFEAAAARRVKPRRREGSVTVGPWPDGSASVLPFALASFVGRETEVDEIGALLGARRLVTLTGPGGIGKTQTALQVAAGFARATNTPVCFAGLATIVDHFLVTPAIGVALGVQQVPSRPLIETLAAYLNDKPLLLILDNCEQVVANVAQIAETLLLKCPQLQILATSREPLMAGGERIYRLPSLTVSDSIALFADRAKAIDPHFSLNDETAPTIAEICRRLEGIPLAIELAAPHVTVLSLKALAGKLNDRLRLLTGGQRTALPRQQTMRATIDWSYNLLSTQEQRVFERLSVFVGGCTLSAATAVCAVDDLSEAATLDVLSLLVEKSLVLADLEIGEPRYWMLEPFRQYAYAKLVERGEERVVARRHALASLSMAEWFNRAFDFEVASMVRDRASHEVHNWRAALQWTLTERHDVVLGQELAGMLGPYFSFFLASAGNAIFFGHMEGRRWLTEALDLVDERIPSSAFAALNYAQARVAGNLREYKDELESSKLALRHYRTEGDRIGIVRAEATLCHAMLYLGRRSEARARLEEALLLARQLGECVSFTQACLLRLLAVATENDPVAAQGYIEEAIRIHKALAHVSSFAMALLDLSECELTWGNAEKALEHAMEALVAAPAGNAFVTCAALYEMSLCLASLARYDEAADRAREALDVACEYRFAVFVAWCVELLATIEAICKSLTPSHAEVCARMLGFTNMRLTTLGSARVPFVPLGYQRAIENLQAAIGANGVASCMAEGASMTEELAVAQMSSLSGPRVSALSGPGLSSGKNPPYPGRRA
ncbi:MAG TPA: helix-turn-helix domain-containing protein [Candidatus Cybelea sp.]